MAPEQAAGAKADRRADIWSFGAVLYEVLSGKRAFGGDSVADTLATVMKLDPAWSALPRDAPPSIHNLVRRCLTKDRKQRLQAIGEARIVLENPGGIEGPRRTNRLNAPSPSPPLTVVVNWNERLKK
jgi:serine/threonine protein kinase